MALGDVGLVGRGERGSLRGASALVCVALVVRGAASLGLWGAEGRAKGGEPRGDRRGAWGLNLVHTCMLNLTKGCHKQSSPA